MDPPEAHVGVLRNVALVCIASIVAVTFTVIYTGRTTAEQSCDNRRAVVEAFDVYTDALASATARPEQTPAERKAREVQVAHFREEIAKGLEPLLAGCT